MLTGDENIVDINFTVFWVVKDAKAYLFNIRNPDATVKSAAESAMREVIGQTEIADALAEGRGKIETDTQKLLQEILDSYGAGDRDHPGPAPEGRSAGSGDRRLPRRAERQDRPAAPRNEAEAYRNNIVPEAHGDAARVVQEAEAYRAAGRARTREGDAARFLSVYNAYKAAQDVTARRLYIETMESILQEHQQDHPRQGGRRARACVPYLPLPAACCSRRRCRRRRPGGPPRRRRRDARAGARR